MSGAAGGFAGAVGGGGRGLGIFKAANRWRCRLPVNNHPAHAITRMANVATFRRKGAISCVEEGINVACPRPKMMVVTTSPINPPPIAHNTILLPDLKAIRPNHAAVAAATGHGIEPMILLFSISLRL